LAARVGFEPTTKGVELTNETPCS